MEESQVTPSPTPPDQTPQPAPAAVTPRPKRRWLKFTILAVIIIVLAAAGAGWWASLKKSVKPATIPTAANQIALEYRAPQPEAISKVELPEERPEPAILYGNGLLVCGGRQDNNASNPYYLHSAQLSRQQVKQLIQDVKDAGFLSLKDHYSQRDVLIDQYETSIALNYMQDGKFYRHESSWYDGPKPAAFAAAQQVIEKRCATVTADYHPDKVILSSRLLPAGAGANLPLVNGSNWPLSDTSPAQIIVTGDTTKSLYQAFGKYVRAKVSQNGKLYEAQVVPTLPTIQQPIQDGTASPDTAQAGGTLAVRYYWFIPAGSAPTSTEQSNITAIANSIYNFYKSQVGNRSYTWSGQPQVLVGRQAASYYTTCHSAGGCANSDQALYDNIRSELQSRGLKPGNESVIVMTSFPSAYGPSYCSGLGGPDAVAFGDVYHDAGGLGTIAGNCLGTYAQYMVPAHEMGHSFALGHTCNEAYSLMDNCWQGGATTSWPTNWHINASQDSALLTQSLAFNHRINGFVKNSSGQPMSGVTVNSCNGVPGTTTDANGYFELRTTTQHPYCVWISGSMISGHTVKATGDNPEHAGATDYQNQIAGYNCHNNTRASVCTSNPATETWDRAQDDGANFTVY